MKLNLQDTFTSELPADPITENTVRQVQQACYSFVTPKTTSNPKILHVSEDMAEALGLTKDDISKDFFKNVFTGNAILKDQRPYAMCYGGHQFGHWAGQLGDGRAINLGEIVHKQKRWAIQLKGAGPTPYSRSADGLAVLRSSIREYLCSEAMHHLGVPTTRALSLALSGDQVLRDIMYNGNAAYEKGAIVCRVAPSFLRFGSYEIFAARRDNETLKTLVDYTLKHFYAHLGAPSKEVYVQFFREVAQRSLDMVIHWQRVGFVHGVMNTDNMSILGLTIDYGPYGWLEGYDMGWTPNTTDRENRRYRYGHQPDIVLWNVFKLANALYPLIDDAPALESILEEFKDNYVTKYSEMMRSKIGLFSKLKEDDVLLQNLEEVLQLTETDMTIFFRRLSDFDADSPKKGVDLVNEAFYKPEELKEDILVQWEKWFAQYALRLQKESLSVAEKKVKMNAVNPKYVLRNYMAQLAIDAADDGDYSLIDQLFQLLKQPYAAQPNMEKWFVKRPEWARTKVGCSMLSCSS